MQVRAMMNINPGNQTGQCLYKAKLRERYFGSVVTCDKSLVLLGDEVYQQSVYQYFEMTNIPPRTVEAIYKGASITLSPNVSTQIFLS